MSVTTKSVRYRILAEFARRVAALAWVGLVVRPGMTGEGDKLAGGGTRKHTSAGKCVVLFTSGHDVPAAADPGERDTMREDLGFDVVLSVLLPEPAAFTAAAHSVGGYTPDDFMDLAGWVNGELLKLTDGVAGQFYESTLIASEEDPTPGTEQLAEGTEYQGGGGEVFDDDGQAMTEHAVTVRYRIPRGQYTVAAG